jgi:DNA repair exonuclease SbcCD nuclease subunit
MDKLPIIFVTLSDIHVGEQSIEQITKEFYDEEKGFFKKLEEVYEYCQAENIKFGGVAITGDFFNHMLSMNSPFAKFAIDFLYSLAFIVIRQYSGHVIIIQGTRSHDLNQLSLAEPLTIEYEGHFHLYTTVGTLEIEGYDILCIPEEYMANQEAFYAPYFNRTYDMILGHGFFKWNCFSVNEIERSLPEMPIFDQKEMIKIARVIVFGHDHGYKTYKDIIFYNGSYSRLCHGEEEEKGGLIVYLDSENVEVERLINELAPKYLSVSLKQIVNDEVTYENAVKAIDKSKKSVDYLKVKIPVDLVKENPTLVELINRHYSAMQKRGIVIDSPAFNLKNGELLILSTVEETESGEEVVTENIHSYLFNNDLELDEKILQFIAIKHGTSEISIDDIRDAVSSPSN